MNTNNPIHWKNSLEQAAIWLGALVIAYSAILGGVSMALPLLIIGVILAYKNDEWQLSRIEVVWVIWAGIYFAFCLINIGLTSGQAELWRFIGEYAFYLLILPLIIAIKAIDVNEIVRKINLLAVPILLLALLLAVVEKFIFHVERVSLLTTSPLVFAPMLCIGIYFALMKKPQNRAEYLRGFAIWFMAFILIAYFAEARGAALAHLGGLVFLIFYYLYNPKNSLKKNALYAALAIFMGILLFAALLYIFAQNPDMGRYYNLSRLVLYGEGELEYSAHTRVLYYQLGVQAIADAPLFGHGLKESFAAIAPNWPYDTDHGHLHSDILNHYVGGGIMGLGLYLGFLIIPLWTLRKNPKPALVFITLTIIALLFVNGVFVRMFLRPQVSAYAMIVLSYVLLLNQYWQPHQKSAESSALD